MATSTYPQRVQRLVRHGCDLLLPAPCAGCNAVGAVLCQECLRELMRRPTVLNTAVPIRSVGRPVAVQSARAVSIVGHVKDRQLVATRHALATALRHAIAATVPACGFGSSRFLVIPVPASKSAWKRRGFVLLESVLGDPTLAQWLAESGADVALDALEWSRHVADQRQLGSAGRQHNLAGALVAHHVSDSDVILVDDVMTTGATCAAASHALMRAGARTIRVAAIAAQPTRQTRHLS